MKIDKNYALHTRNNGIDVAKGIAIFLVVYAHASEIFFFGKANYDGQLLNIWKYIYSFHMPLFFVLSGMLVDIKSTRHVVTSALSLVLFAQLTNAIGWLVEFATYYPLVSFQHLVISGLANTSFSIMVTWFLVAIGLVKILYHILSTGAWRSRLLVAIALILTFAVGQVTGSTAFQIGIWLPGTLFYALGHRLAKLRLTERLPPATLSLPLVIALLIAVRRIGKINHGCLFVAKGPCGDFSNDFAVFMISNKIGFLPSFLGAALLGSLAVVMIAALVARTPSFLSRGLAWMGRSSLDLLILNGFVLVFAEPLIKTVTLARDFPLYQEIGGAVGLTLAQVLFLPVVTPLTQSVRALSKTLARLIVRQFLRMRAFLAAEQEATW